jgi:hypothetical protein
MTPERPMFPPRADECQVIDFESFALAAKILKAPPEDRSVRKARIKAHRDERIAKRAAKLLEVTTAPENFSETCRNHRLRQSRRDAWRAADHLADYWHARMEWQSALETAQTYNVADANSSFPKCEDGVNRWTLLDLWRDALVQQMLTPAPDQGAVTWKRAQLRGGQHRYVGVKDEKLQRAIEKDEEWLKSHPSRKSIAASRQAKKDKP